MNVETGLGVICRLCGKEEKYLIDIFSNDGKKQKLEKKIRLCLPITVTVDDEMPRRVCLDCLNKLDAAYELYMGCIVAQHYIREKLAIERRQVHPNYNGSLQSGFLTDQNSLPVKSTAADTSLRNVLGLQRTFSSFIGVEQKRLEEENIQRTASSTNGVRQQPSIQYAHNSSQYTNNMAQVNVSSNNGHLVGTQLDGTNIVLSASNIPMMQANDSQVAGNLQGQVFVSPHANTMNPSVSVTPASVPVMASSQSTLRSPAQLTVPCNQSRYTLPNNLPSSLHIMPLVQVGSPDGPPVQYAPVSSLYQSQSSSMPQQNGVPLSQAQDHNSQFRPPTSSNSPYVRRLLDAQTTTMVNSDPSLVVQTTKTASSLFNHIPPPVTMSVASSVNNTGQMHVSSAMQQQQQQQQPQQHMDIMQQTVSLWMNKQSAAKTGSSAVTLQPIITQVTSGYQNAVPDQTSQEGTVHMDLSNDTDDDMVGETGQNVSDLTEDENVKPFALSTTTLPQTPKKLPRRRQGRAVTMEMCPHCQKELRSDIIFHHIKLHFRQSFFSCLDCGRNYSSEKALEAHKCPGEVQ